MNRKLLLLIKKNRTMRLFLSNKKQFSFVILIALVLSLFAAIAQIQSYNDSLISSGISLKRESNFDVTLNSSTPEYLIDNEGDGNQMQDIIMPQAFILNDEGAPNLPAPLVADSVNGPVWSIDPTELIENHATNNMITSKYLTVTNLGSEDLTWELNIQRASTAGPDVVLDPEWVAEQYAQRAALEGDPFSERNISPSRGGFMDNILEEFDLQFEYPVGVGGGEAGIEADANYIYTSKWNGTDFYRYDYDGTYVGSFAIPGAGQIRDLAYDGTYFYGGKGSSTVYIMDFDGQTLIGQFTAPTAVRAIAWDDGEEGLWANNWSTTITLFDLQGAVLGTIPNAGDESFYGFAYDHQGPYLWGYGQSGLNNNQLYKYALPSGSLELTHDVFPMLSLVASGDIAGGLAFQPDIVTGFNTLLGLVQNVCLWGIEMGNTTLFDIDVGVSSIVSPNSGVNLGSSEPVVIKIKNHGANSVSNIPWSVNMTGQGSASFNGTYSGSLAPGAYVEISVGTVNLSVHGTYNFEACTNLAGDENPNNNCKTKAVKNNEPSICWDNLYSTGCTYGDGLISWDFVNINVPNIPCSGYPPWYHDYRDMVHEVEAGQTYVLTVTAGYTDTYFDIWVDFDHDLYLDNATELIMNDGLCATANTPYTFNITIPANAPAGTHIMRFRTNWASPVTDPCATYTFGNCCDFKIQIGGDAPWLSAPVTSGLVPAGQSSQIEVVFNSDGLPVSSVKNGNLIFTTNAPGSPHDVPATLNVGGDPAIVFDPTALTENHAQPNTITTQTLNVTNNTEASITFNIDIQRASTAGPDIEVDPEWVAEQYAMRQAAEGAILSLGKTVPGGASPNMTDDEIIRWDDGVNDDAIGLVNGGTFYVAAYFPVSTMGQYSGMKLNQVEIFVYDVPTSMVLRINGQGTATTPGPLLHSQPLTNLTSMTWHMIDLTDPVDITGEYLWIGYEVTHNSGSYPASCDGGPAVAGFGDMISIDGTTYQSMATAYGLNYNWNIAGYLIPGEIFAKDVGVQIISTPNTGINLTVAEVVKFTIKNYGTDAQSNIPWTVTMTGQGSASFNGIYSGPLAAEATAEITVGTANLSAYGIYNFEACTNLAGDENPNNNCKTKFVENKEPSLCVNNLYSVGCTYGDGLNSWDFVNINVPNIPCSGIPAWYHDYRDMVHEVEAGQTYVLSVTAGSSSTYFDVWIDFNDDLILNNANELILNDGLCLLKNTLYTFNITIPADVPGGSHVMRFRTKYNSPVTDPCATYSYGNCCDFKILIVGDNPWLSASPLTGTILPGETFPVTVTFNSTDLQGPITKTGVLSFLSNAPGSPYDVPATLSVGSATGPIWYVEPSQLHEIHATNNMITSKYLTVINLGSEDLTWDLTIQRASTAGPDVVLDPELVAEQYAQRAALEGDPLSERNISPSCGGFMDNILEDFYLQFEYPVGVGGGEAGIEADANYIYTSKWNGTDFYRYDYDGTYVGSFAIPGAGQIRDLAYDGTYFYGGQGSSTVYIMDFVGQTLIGQFSAPTAVRAIAWDDGEEGLWANNWSTTITLFDLQGAVLGTIPNAGDESFYGFAYDHQGPYLWGYGQSGLNNNQLYKYALPSGSLELTHDVFPMLSLVASGDIAGGLAFQPDIVTGFNTLLGLVQNVCLWGIEMGNTTLFDIDVGVSSIVSPNSGVNLGSSEPVVIKIKNHGVNSVSNIPWSVNMTGQGSASFNGTYSGSLAPGADVEISVGTVNLSAYGTYTFEACTNLADDQNPSNDCKTKALINNEPLLCVDNLYSSGCSLGDGLTSWDFANINVPNIPCSGTPPWYHDYRDMVHEVEAGQTYVLTVTAGYTNTYFDVRIDFNDDLVLNNADELILNDGLCATANTPYTFNITIPADAPGGAHVIRYRTNWSQPVTDPCATYNYGNCCDFKIQIGGGTPWLSAPVTSGLVPAGQSLPIEFLFNSNGLPSLSVKKGNLIFTTNVPESPHDVPVTFVVAPGTGPIWNVTPSELIENHPTNNTVTYKDLTITNLGDETLYVKAVVQRASIAGPDIEVDPEWVAEQYAMRQAAEGAILSLGKTVPGGASPNMTDDEIIRWDDGVNADAIGLSSGGTFYTAAYFPVSTMGQYSGMKLNQVEIFVYDVPTSMVLRINGQGTATTPGPLLHSQPLTNLTGMTWHMIDLTDPVDITGEDLWIGYEVIHNSGTYPAGCDGGPAVAGFGDMISMDGTTYELMSRLGLNYNWNIAGYLIQVPTFAKDVGVKVISAPNTGINLTVAEVVKFNIKNYGTAAQSNIPWTVTMTGQASASFNGAYAGPLAAGATAEITAGTANLLAYGIYNFEACTNLAGDENPNNNCKTKSVENKEPSLCVDNLYSSGCSYGDGLISWDFANINVPNIPCSGTPPWYHDYRDMVHEVEAGQTYVLTVTAGYSNTNFDVWIDFNDDLILNNADELILNDAVCASTNTPYTFNITIPADAPGGTHVLRYRTNWSQPVTDPCAPYIYGNCCDFMIDLGESFEGWISVFEGMFLVEPCQSIVTQVKFNSAGLDFGTYTGSVIFNNNSSTPVVTVPVTLIVEQDCLLPPPTDLTLQQTGYNPNVVQLTWVAPEEPGGVLRWDNGINNDGIGLVNGGTFAVAAKWNPDQLTQHVGLYLKQVDIFPRSATATYIIKVWTSATVSQPVVSQSATVVSEQWNTITLTNPVQIEAGKPLYIGYETTHAISEYPAGCDSGPAIANFGDLISTGGGAWVSMSTQFGLNYNWNIAGIIDIGTDGAAPAVPIVITPNPDVSYGSPVAGNLGKPNNAKWVNTSRALVGYDIKRDGQVIGSVGPTVTTYTDSNVQGGTRIYNVGAHYTECTAWSDPATINVFVTELSPDATTLRIYPNPASETVNIESTTIKQIIIVNNLGQVVYDSPFNNDYVQINTSNLRKGMYVIFIRTAGTTFTEKLIIK